MAEMPEAYEQKEAEDDDSQDEEETDGREYAGGFEVDGLEGRDC